MAAPTGWDGYRARVEAGLLKADFVVAPTPLLDDIEQLDIDRKPRVSHSDARSGTSASASSPSHSCSPAAGHGTRRRVDIIDRLAARLPWPVFVAGATTGADGSECRIPAHAHALGSLRQDELATWLAGASRFVLPPRHEPFGLSVLEAAMSGCPLVLGDLDTLRELLGRRRRLRSDA